MGTKTVVTALVALSLSTATAASPAQPGAGAQAATAKPQVADTWTGTWTAPVLDQQLTNGDGSPVALSHMTVRQSFRTSIGGSKIRVRVSNLFGRQPLTIRDLHLARASSDHAIVQSTDRALAFGGASSVTIPAGQEVTSDPLAYVTTASTDYAVSMYLASAVDANHVTAHRQAWQDIYLASGDVSANPTITPVGSPIGSYLFLTGVDVVNTAASGAIVALGASITDGSNTSYGANRRWTNDLAVRLQAAKLNVAVLGAGLSGGHLLDDEEFGGPSALNRFKRDVLSQASVKWVISSDTAINDLSGHSDANGNPDGSGPTAAQLISATQQLIAQSHAAGVKFLCSTLTPNVGRSKTDWTPVAEQIREQLNDFYKSASSGCDGIVDQDVATHDPASPLQYRPSFNSNDFLHPNDAGTQAIANAVNLKTFAPGGLPPVTGPSTCGALLPGQGIKVDQPLVSCDGRFQLLVQGDSNMVLYLGQSPLWSSNTVGKGAAMFTLLADGNAVLYDTKGNVLYQTGTAGLQSTALMVQNDGNVVIYGAGPGEADAPVFATNTCCH